MLSDRIQASGYSFEQLAEKVWDLAPEGHPCGSHPYRRYEAGLLRPDRSPGFRTPTGKVELCCSSYAEWGYDPLPYYRELEPQSEEKTPEIFKDYPLIMMTGRRSPVLFHSEHRQIPWLRECDPDPLVEISPETAAEKNIKTGDWVLIEGTMGAFKRKAKVTPMIDPRTVMVPHAWWLPEEKGWRLEPVQGVGPQLQSADPHGLQRFLRLRGRPAVVHAGESLKGRGRGTGPKPRDALAGREADSRLAGRKLPCR